MPSGRMDSSDAAAFWIAFQNTKSCWYCGIKLSFEQPKSGNKHYPPTMATKDHRIPLKRGGSRGVQNIVRACLACNTTKAGLDPEEFRLLLAYRAGKVVLKTALPRFHGELAENQT